MKPAPLSDEELISILESEEQDAVGYFRSEIASAQEDALKYYFGEPFGDEVEGRSQVISLDVRETVEWTMPDMARIFTQGSHVAEFEPGDLDEVADRFDDQESVQQAIQQALENARDATEYCNRAFWVDNPGFRLWENWAKDGMIQKLGVMRVDWQEPEWGRVETHRNLTTAQLQALQALEDEDKAEIVEHEESEADKSILDEMGNPLYFDGYEHKVRVRRKKPYGKIIITGVAPEEFLLKRASRDVSKASYKAYRTYKTLSDLAEEFPEKSDELWGMLSSDNAEDLDTRKQTRFFDEDYYPADDPTPIDRASTEIKYVDEFIEVDYDGDGITELRNVKRAGRIILFNEEVDDDPFVEWCPIRIPHKVYGFSLADETMDIQRIKSVLWRQHLDSIYQQVSGRWLAVDNKVNLDDLLTVRPGAVRADQTVQDVRNVIMPLVPPDTSGAILPALEYVDQEAEGRTGISRYSQGMDPDSLNKTATGIQLLQNASNGRKEMIARNMAEGLEKLFRKMLRLLIQNDNSQRIIRLKDNQFKAMDPSRWSPDMDMHVHVGLGTGSREQQLANLGFIAGKLEQVMLNAGPDNPLVSWDNVYAVYTELAETAGFKGPERFFSNPKDHQPGPPKPDPEVQKEEIKAQAKMVEVQQRAQSDLAELQQQGQLKAQEIAFERQKTQEEIQAKREQLILEIEFKQWAFEQELELKRWMHNQEMQMKRELGVVAEAGKVEQARIKTDAHPGGEPG